MRAVQSIKSSAISIKNKVSSIKESIFMKIKKHKRKIIIITVTISILLLTLGLLLGSISSINALSQGVLANWTQQRLKDGGYRNEVKFTGLASSFIKFKSTNFLIIFNKKYKDNKGNQLQSGPIIARVLQGTKLQVQATIQCQIIVGDRTRQFIEEYGNNWQKYLRQKTKNDIIQTISQIRFYELNNQKVVKLINNIFLGYFNNIVKYPFKLQLINILFKYPQGSFSVNNTLGVQLLLSKSQLNQLQTQYANLQSDNITFYSLVRNYYMKKGQLEGFIEGRSILSKVNSNWEDGFKNVSLSFSGINSYTEKYLWLYFQNIYNQTFKDQPLVKAISTL